MHIKVCVCSCVLLIVQKFTYTVKIYDPERRSKFTLRDLHSICHQFDSVKALRSALYHELEDEIPDGDYNVGYFEGSQHKKKWLSVILWPCMPTSRVRNTYPGREN